MARKKTTKKKVKKVAKKAPVKEKPEEEKKKKVRDLQIDLSQNVAEQLVDFWQEKEPDNIHGMDGNADKTLGVAKVIYSGLPTLDRVLAYKEDTKIYGLPLNKMFEIYGSESSGKTTLCKYFCGVFLKVGGIAHFVDFEHKYYPSWMKTIGNNMGLKDRDYKRLQHIKPKSFEWFVIWLIKMMKVMIDTKAKARAEIKDLEAKTKKPDDYGKQLVRLRRIVEIPTIVVVDSLASAYTEAEVKGEEESKKHIAELARSLSVSLKLIRRLLGDSDTLIIWTNQERDKIPIGHQEQFAQKRFGRMMSTPGGNAIKHFCDARIKISFAGPLNRVRNNVKMPFGTEHSLRITKNQMGPRPFQQATIRLLHDRGFHSLHSVLEACSDAGLIKHVNDRYVVTKGIQFGSNEIDEIQAEQPKMEEILHSIYRKWMTQQ